MRREQRLLLFATGQAGFGDSIFAIMELLFTTRAKIDFRSYRKVSRLFESAFGEDRIVVKVPKSGSKTRFGTGTWLVLLLLVLTLSFEYGPTAMLAFERWRNPPTDMCGV